MKNKEESKLREIEDFIIDEIGSYLDSIGAKHLYGRIFGLLIVQNKPLSLSDIASRLNVSKPAVSTTIQAGVQMGMFKKSYRPDSPRENFYETDSDFVQTMIDPGIHKLSSLHSRFKRAAELFEGTNPKTEDLKVLKRKIEYIEKSFDIFLKEYKKFGVHIKKEIEKLK